MLKFTRKLLLEQIGTLHGPASTQINIVDKDRYEPTEMYWKVQQQFRYHKLDWTQLK